MSAGLQIAFVFVSLFVCVSAICYYVITGGSGQARSQAVISFHFLYCRKA